jgi:hypothetical protein
MCLSAFDDIFAKAKSPPCVQLLARCSHSNDVLHGTGFLNRHPFIPNGILFFL